MRPDQKNFVTVQHFLCILLFWQSVSASVSVSGSIGNRKPELRGAFPNSFDTDSDSDTDPDKTYGGEQLPYNKLCIKIGMLRF